MIQKVDKKDQRSKLRTEEGVYEVYHIFKGNDFFLHENDYFMRLSTINGSKSYKIRY